ncbi:MAG: alanine--tRNA ligase [Actinomycetota bacterium]|nr:alanine--tRNA ligase [Actinomycetota bacterium]
MPEISSEFVRETFLEFFRARHHTVIEGASVLARDDPTLLFVNAGMAPLKDYFTGIRRPPTPNLTNIQPCIRTIDIDDIGDRHHLTFFEMMGSWSIGEYFKDKAIELAYELMIDGFGFEPSQLYVTVHEGDEALSVEPDEESERAWARVGMPADRIVRQPTADNFWGPAGDSGPCGPCTEMFLDTGDAYGEAYRPGGPFDTHRYIEIWNAGVFMVYDKGLDGRLSPLPFKSVDTGSGLERVTLALNGFDNLYETDLLAPVVAAVKDVLGETGPTDRHHRIIADHLRAAVAIMSEGVRPSNEGAGYIPRRLLRRSATLALTRGQTRFDYRPVVDAVVGLLGGHYPRFASELNAVNSAIGAEMSEFEGALQRGLGQLDDLLAKQDRFSGADAFRLWSTFGLPVEIAAGLAAERGAVVDLGDLDTERKRHQDDSRGGLRTDRRTGLHDPLPASVLALPATTFVGYDTLSGDAEVLALLGASDPLGVGDEADLIVDRTPLYGESGGQVGDHGRVDGPDGWGSITDTVVHRSGMFLHRLRVEEGMIAVGQRVYLRVEADGRMAAAANHSATHLVNAALRRVLGDHVHQAGSLVDPVRMRFDFTHPKPVSPDELDEIERLVNDWVLTDLVRRVKVMTPAAAIASGATSLEGEIYPEEVRVISFGDVSTELCGGTHVEHTSTLGLFRIVAQESVASGVRRITAYTRRAAVDYSLDQARTLGAVSTTVHSSPRDVVAAVERLVTKAARSATARPDPAALTPAVLTEGTAGAFDIAYGALPVDAKGLRPAAAAAVKTTDRVAVVWTAANPATMVVAVPKRYEKSLDARHILKSVLGPFGGSGGGAPAMAQGGGATLLDASQVATAITEAISDVIGG